MSLSFSTECPKLVSSTEWGGVNFNVFSSICDSPLLIKDICNGNQKVKEIFAAYLYLTFVGEVCEYPYSTVSIDGLDKAELLCPNEDWIANARKDFDEIKSLDLQLKNTTEIKKKQDNQCFIATASYGTEFANEVIFLKRFRDELLCHYDIGRFFIKHYYRISPYIARIISKSEIIKMFIRNIVLNPIVFVIRYFLEKNNTRG